MRKAMFFPKGDENTESVISSLSPIKYNGNKKIILSRGINWTLEHAGNRLLGHLQRAVDLHKG